MNNIKFKYLYRDESNYKKYGHVVFSNPDGVSAEEVKTRLEKSFLQALLFNASQVGLPELFFEDFPLPNDFTLHEFDGVETTDELPNDHRLRTIQQFMKKVEKESAKRWVVIDPLERLFRH